MISVALCDDNDVFLKKMSKVINSKLAQQNLPHNIFLYSKGNDFLNAHKEKPFDVAFLDIAMPEINGFEIAKEIRKISENTYIIFITTESTLVYDSLDFRPFHFIPKNPAEQLELRIDHVIKKLAQHMTANKSIEIDLPYKDKKFIAPASIISVKSSANYIEITLVKGEPIRIRGNMETAKEMLPEQMFVRIHNRFIVNMKHIKRIDYPNNEVHMTGDSVIEISRTYKKALEDVYNLFLRNLS